MAFNKISGFTLQESLVVLVLLGVIATLTIPNFINEYRTRVYITQLKEAYAILSNAVYMARLEYGNKEWEKNFTKYVGPFLNVTKDCSSKYNKNCTPVTDYVDMFPGAGGYAKDFNQCNRNGNYDNNACFPYKLILDNGMIIYARSNGDVVVDINGGKKPNRKNVDLFSFKLNHDNGIIFGNDVVVNGVIYEEGCVSKNGAYWDNSQASRCTKWVLNRNNMDYLKKYNSW